MRYFYDLRPHNRRWLGRRTNPDYRNKWQTNRTQSTPRLIAASSHFSRNTFFWVRHADSAPSLPVFSQHIFGSVGSSKSHNVRPKVCSKFIEFIAQIIINILFLAEWQSFICWMTKLEIFEASHHFCPPFRSHVTRLTMFTMTVIITGNSVSGIIPRRSCVHDSRRSWGRVGPACS